MTLGYIYLIRGAGLYKIGASAQPARKRLVNLQTGSPVPLTVVYEYPNLESRYRRKKTIAREVYE